MLGLEVLGLRLLFESSAFLVLRVLGLRAFTGGVLGFEGWSLCMARNRFGPHPLMVTAPPGTMASKYFVGVPPCSYDVTLRVLVGWGPTQP